MPEQPGAGGTLILGPLPQAGLLGRMLLAFGHDPLSATEDPAAVVARARAEALGLLILRPGPADPQRPLRQLRAAPRQGLRLTTCPRRGAVVGPGPHDQQPPVARRPPLAARLPRRLPAPAPVVARAAARRDRRQRGALA